jgi:amidase
MVPIADGSDMGGSLRNPAAFCNVVGLRPAPGRVPFWPTEAAWFTFSVQGPMARTVADVALLLSAMAGPDPRAPIAIAEGGARFRAPLGRDFTGVRLAWSRDLGGLPVDARISAVLDARRRTFEELGAVVEDGQPDFSDAREIFQALRAWAFSVKYRHLLADHRHEMKDTVIWNIEAADKLTARDIGEAELKRTELYHRVRRFMETYEFLILPVTQVLMRACSDITVTGLPAISVPAGFTPEGLPVGVQIVGRHQDEWGVLQLAHAFEQATGFGQRRPTIAS